MPGQCLRDPALLILPLQFCFFNERTMAECITELGAGFFHNVGFDVIANASNMIGYLVWVARELAPSFLLLGCQ